MKARVSNYIEYQINNKHFFGLSMSQVLRVVVVSVHCFSEIQM